MDDNLFFALFVDVVEELALKKFGNHSQITKAFWGPQVSPSRWRTLRNGGSKGRRGIKIQDMMRFADALGERLSSLIFQVEERARMGVLPKERGAGAVKDAITLELPISPERESNMCAEKIGVPNNAETVTSND